MISIFDRSIGHETSNPIWPLECFNIETSDVCTHIYSWEIIKRETRKANAARPQKETKNKKKQIGIQRRSGSNATLHI